MSSNKKNELILQTYEMLKTTSPEDIKIRSIAAACNCTSTVIYKHFDDLDHLLRFSSVRFLENYIIDIQKDINEASDSLEMLVSMWRTFSYYAFENLFAADIHFGFGVDLKNVSEIRFTNIISYFRMNGKIWTACLPAYFLIMI